MLAFLFLPAVIDFLPAFIDKTSSLNLYADLRERYEIHENPTFFGDGGKNNENIYSRLRIGAEYKPAGKLSGTIEYQNAHDLFWNQKVNGSTDNSDASLAFAKYSTGDLTVIGGRQKYALGQQRLIGASDWRNLGSSLDGGRVVSGQWTALAAKLGVASIKPETARVNLLSHEDKGWGTTSLISKHDLGPHAPIDVQALDHFVTYTFGKTTLDGEAVTEYGSSNGKDLRAWAYHARASQAILPSTTLRIEVNAASGGSNATTTRTFDNLYPAVHDQWGLADMIGWMNMNDLAIKVENRSLKSVTFLAEAHDFSLRDPSDAWYSGNGTVNTGPGGKLIDKTGGSGREIGREYDFLATLSMKSNCTFLAGIAVIQPGNFVQTLTGNSSQFVYGFLQFQGRF